MLVSLPTKEKGLRFWQWIKTNSFDRSFVDRLRNARQDHSLSSTNCSKDRSASVLGMQYINVRAHTTREFIDREGIGYCQLCRFIIWSYATCVWKDSRESIRLGNGTDNNRRVVQGSLANERDVWILVKCVWIEELMLLCSIWAAAFMFQKGWYNDDSW